MDVPHKYVPYRYHYMLRVRRKHTGSAPPYKGPIYLYSKMAVMCRNVAKNMWYYVILHHVMKWLYSVLNLDWMCSFPV